MKLLESVADAIGATPLVALNNITTGLSGRILGNSAHAILDSSPCSMLIVPRF